MFATIALLLGMGLIAPGAAVAKQTPGGGKGNSSAVQPSHGDRDDGDEVCPDADDNGKHKGDKNHGGPGEDDGLHKGEKNHEQNMGKHGGGDDENCDTSGIHIATTASSNALVDDALGDFAQLTGGNNPTGKITFSVFGPSDTTCSSALFSSDVPVNGNGNYAMPADPGFTATEAGVYQWIASFTSDKPQKNESVSGKCGDPGESTTVSSAVSGLAIDKKVNGGDHKLPGDALEVEPGTTVDYTIVITNTSADPMTISALSDTLRDNLAGDCDHGDGFVLLPGDTINCAYSTLVTGTLLHNVASVTGTAPGGDPVTVMDETFTGAVLPVTPQGRPAKAIVTQPHQTG